MDKIQFMTDSALEVLFDLVSEDALVVALSLSKQSLLLRAAFSAPRRQFEMADRTAREMMLFSQPTFGPDVGSIATHHVSEHTLDKAIALGAPKLLDNAHCERQHHRFEKMALESNNHQFVATLAKTVWVLFFSFFVYGLISLIVLSWS
jgi:hypothetical protein